MRTVWNESNAISSSNNILVMVLTTENNILTRGIACYETWGKQFKDIVFSCNCPNIMTVKNLLNQNKKIPPELSIFKNVAHLPILNVNITEHVNNMGKKVFVVLKESFNKYKTKWYFMIDDDSYVFVDNLNKFIKNKDTNAAKMYGFKFLHTSIPGGHIGGELNYLLS